MNNLKNKNELIKQGVQEFFHKKTILFHVEYPSICNQHCSYCLEGNFSTDKIEVEPWDTKKFLDAIDKIFNACDESYQLGFIWTGGEAVLQPSFLDAVKKIKSRKNTYQVLTTNFTSPEEFYRELDIPLITSLHLDFHEPKDWIKKTIALHDLIMETRIMAHPQKMDKVKEAYNLFLENQKNYNLNFSVEKVDAFTLKGKNNKIISYVPNYKEEDIHWIKEHLTQRIEYNQDLSKKAGILKSIFYKSIWQYSSGEEKFLQFDKKNFKNWFCERNIVVIKPDGTLYFGWYCDTDTGHNIFNDMNFPINKLKTVICDKKECLLSFGAASPKYKYIKYAPKYINKTSLYLLKYNQHLCKLKNAYKKLKRLKKIYKIMEG